MAKQPKSKGPVVEAMAQVDAASEAAEAQETQAPVARRERPKNMETVSSGASYWDFEKNPIFEGHFVKLFLAPKDIPKNNTKKGDVIGFTFVDQKGAFHILGNSHAIAKALEEDKFNQHTLWWIEFLEKVTSGGKPFNNFYIGKQK